MKLILRPKKDVTVAQIGDAIAQVPGISVLESGKFWLVQIPDDSNHLNFFWETGLFEFVSPEFRIPLPDSQQSVSMDADLAALTEDQAKQKLQEIRNVVRWWASQRGDDRCWVDDIKVMETVLPHGEVNFEMPEDLEFIENCIRFKQSRCPKNYKLHEW